MDEQKKTIAVIVLIFVLGTILVSIFIFAFKNARLFLTNPREGARRITCASNLKSMGLSFIQYSMDYGGYFPDKNGAAGFEQLRDGDYLRDYKMFGCPSTNLPAPPGYNVPLEEKYVSYVYRSGLTATDAAGSAIVWDSPNNHTNFGNILFVDGHVKGYAGSDWMKNIK